MGSGAEVEHLFFDLGGTLVDLSALVPAMSESIQTRFPNLAAQASGIAEIWVRLTDAATPLAQGQEFQSEFELARAALQQAFDEVSFRLDSRASIDLVTRAWSSFVSRARLQKDVTKGILAEVKALVKTLGIITDSDVKAVSSLLSRLGIRQVFDVVVVSETVGAYKPNPRIYRAAAEQVRALPGECGLVSDSVLDLDGAASVGMTTFWVRRSKEQHRVPKGTMILTDLAGLLDVLR